MAFRAGVEAFLSTHTHTHALWSAASLSVNGYMSGNYQETTSKLPGLLDSFCQVNSEKLSGGMDVFSPNKSFFFV